MPINGFAPLAPLPPLAPIPSLSPQGPAESPPAGNGFASVLNGLLDNNRQANDDANAAVQALATGESQDLHTVTLAVTQADLSFRLILELRNRLTDALQEVTRMQV